MALVRVTGNALEQPTAERAEKARKGNFCVFCVFCGPLLMSGGEAGNPQSTSLRTYFSLDPDRAT